MSLNNEDNINTNKHQNYLHILKTIISLSYEDNIDVNEH